MLIGATVQNNMMIIFDEVYPSILYSIFSLIYISCYAPVWQTAMQVHAFLCIFNNNIILNISLFLKFMIYAELLCLCSEYTFFFFLFISYLLVEYMFVPWICLMERIFWYLVNLLISNMYR